MPFKVYLISSNYDMNNFIKEKVHSEKIYIFSSPSSWNETIVFIRISCKIQGQSQAWTIYVLDFT